MDYELIKCLNTVILGMMNIRPIDHIHLLQNKWPYCVLLIASQYPVYCFHFLLLYAFTLYLHVYIILTIVLYSSCQLTLYSMWLKLVYYYTDTVEIILYYECECVLRDEYIETCLDECIQVGIYGVMWVGVLRKVCTFIYIYGDVRLIM